MAVDDTAAQRTVFGSRAQRWWFRLVALCLACVPFLAVEALCWVCGWGAAADPADPFVEFSTVRPLFDRSADGSRWEVTPSRRRFFSDESFPARKPAGTWRVFIVGESTVAGEPFGKPTSFPTWLQLALQAGDPHQGWNVVNCGGVSYASYRLAPIVEECLTHEPHLIILAIGHNEFLEERTYAPIRATPSVVRSLYDFAHRWRAFRAVRGWVNAASAANAVTTLPDEITTRLDYEAGLEAYHRDEAGRAAVIAHYEFNLRRMVRRVQAAGVPLILIRQPSNLSDCPPFKSEYDPRVSAADRARCEGFVAEAHERLARDLPGAVKRLESAVQIDPTFARTQYELGKCYETLGRTAQAREAFLAARERDVCPLRMLGEMERILAQVADETHTPLVDLHELLERQSQSGILGDYLLVDHVHPSIAGHQLIAKRLATELQALGLHRPGPESAAAIEAAFAAHLASLDPEYYLRGQRTLRSLQIWAAGRAAQPETGRAGGRESPR
jgi:lysophospholipase L1-like esterase